MKIDDFLAKPNNEHKVQGNPHVKCNALYKTGKNLNCLLTASQAIQHAQNILQKAQLILDAKLEDAAVHVWSVGSENEKLYCGIHNARKGQRRKKKKPKPN